MLKFSKPYVTLLFMRPDNPDKLMQTQNDIISTDDDFKNECSAPMYTPINENKERK